MQQLATSVGARILTPNAQDTYLRAKQSLDREVNHPEQGFLCGAQAIQAIITAKNSSVVYAPAVGAVRSTQPAVGLEGSRLYITLHIETLKRNARAHSIHLEAHAVPDLTSATPITQYAFVYCIDSTPPGLPLKYAYDKLNRLTSVTYPDGSTDSIQYVKLDPSIYTDRQGRVTQVMYDKNRRLSVVIDPELRFTQYLWCSCGALEEFVDPNGNFTSFIRDLQGRLLSKVYPDRSTENISYDSVGRVASTFSPKGITTYAYYPDNQPETISTADLAPIQSTYDQTYGFLTNISQGSLSYAYSYNPVGAPGALRPSQISAPNGSTSFKYDALGRVSSWSTANGTESYQFDQGGRLSQVQNPLGTFSLSYLGATGQIAKIAYPNQTSENYSYQPNNQDRRLSALTFTGPSGNISSYGYQYNPVGTISRWSIQTASNGQSKTFSPDYDVADQLVSSLVQVTEGSSATQSQYGYSYDNAGNRTGFQSDLTVASAQANWLNQLTQVTTGQGPLTVFGNTNRPSTVSVNGVSAKNLPNNSCRSRGSRLYITH